MENKFFTFIRPYLSFIDNGDLYRKPFSWLYIVFAGLNLLLPLYILYMAISNHIFSGPFKIVLVFFLAWLIIAFASWISFQLWWDRKDKIASSSSAEDEFIATPVFCHLIQTMGEWIGTWVAIVGFGVALLMTLFLGKEASMFASQMGFSFIGTGFVSIIIMPIYGFLIIVGSRFIAEQAKALAAIANNTKK